MHLRLALAPLLLLWSCSSAPVVDGGTGGGSSGGGAGGGSGGGGGGSPAPVAFADYCATYNSTLCALDVRCGRLDSASCSRFYGGAISANCLGGTAWLVDAGQVAYDGQKARTCFDQLAAGPCTWRGLQLYESCTGVFSGTKPVGQPCYSAECVSGAWCDSSGATCPGTCRARVDAGAAAPSAAACPAGTLYAGGVCNVPAPIGSSCTLAGSLGGKPCELGGWCDVVTAGGMVCRPYADAGAPCSGPFNADLTSECTVFGTCVPNGDAGFVCGVRADRNQPCGPAGCRLGLWCSARDGGGTCQDPAPAGSTCYADSECAPPLVCLRSSGLGTPPGTCSSRGGLDAGCLFDSDCQDGLACPQQVCVAAAGPGQPCTGTSCVSGYLCGGDAGCVRAFCAP